MSVTDPTPIPTDPPKGDPAEHMIPKSRVDAEIAKTRAAEERAAALQKQIDDAAEVARKADEERQAKQGEFETLAKTRESERDALKAKHDAAKERVKALNDRLHLRVDAEIKDWPEKLKAKVPSKEDQPDAESRAAKVDELADLLPDLSGDPATGTPPGTGNRPQPRGGLTPAGALDEAKKRLRASGAYSKY